MNHIAGGKGKREEFTTYDDAFEKEVGCMSIYICICIEYFLEDTKLGHMSVASGKARTGWQYRRQ